MKTPSKNSCDTRFLYVHGTNGSGKSTLARAVIAAAGGVTGVEAMPMHKKAHYTTTSNGTVLVGKYGTACGGVDGLSPYASISDILLLHAVFPECRVMAEGLITPGLETCQKLAGMVDKAMFIYLDTPAEQCIANVLKRRGRKGTTKEYDPDNLHKKRRSAQSWATRLKDSGLDVRELQWNSAYLTCLNFLGIDPDLNHILGTTP